MAADCTVLNVLQGLVLVWNDYFCSNFELHFMEPPVKKACKEFVCTVCQKIYRTKKYFTKHVQSHQQGWVMFTNVMTF